MNESEQRFSEYLTASGYEWLYEPDYQLDLGLDEPTSTRPDFLVIHETVQAVCEVRQFKTTRITERLIKLGGYGTLSAKEVYGTQRSALVEKAQQLAPFSGLGLPLVVVLSNPLGADVRLDDHHVLAAMFGNPRWSIPISPETEAAAGPGEFKLEDYGAFRSLRPDGAIVNPHPHVSAVAVLHHRTRSQLWREQIMDKHSSADKSLDAALEAALQGTKEVEREIEVGNEPEGEIRWLAIYELDGAEAEPLPRDWFVGERHTRHAFLSDGTTYGPLDAQRGSSG